MSVTDTGYATYFDKECTFVRDGMRLFLVSTNENDHLSEHFSEKNYYLQLKCGIFKNCTAYVKRQLFSDLQSVSVEFKYFTKRIDDEDIYSLEITANEVDEFFTPLDYYFRKMKSGKYSASDLLYSSQVVSRYSFKYSNQDIEVDIVYGNVLSDGIRSDLFIHPILSLKFDKTSDTDFLYELYEIIVKFLQFVHRKQSYNIKRIDLYSDRNGRKSHSGNMVCSEYNSEIRSKPRIESSFMYYGEKISNIFNIIAQEKESFPVSFLNYAYPSYYEYTPERVAALFSAFEYEYKNNNEYPQKSMEGAQALKDKIIDYISSCKEETEVEGKFKETAINNIHNIGGGLGLTRKIKEAYTHNKEAFMHSNQSLFSRNGDLEKSAKRLNNIRQTVVHDNMGRKFDDDDIECLRFLEVLQFVMTLKRAKYSDQEIEVLIGIVYGCNSEYIKIM